MTRTKTLSGSLIPRNDQPLTQIPPAPTPTLIRQTAMLLFGAVLASAAVLAIAGVLNHPPAWFLIGFECVLVVTGLMGFLTAKGRYQEGFGATLAVFAVIIAVASELGYLGAGRKLLGFDLRMVLMARFAAAAVIGTLGGVAVLLRRPRRSFPLIGRGVVFGCLCVGLAAGLWFAQARTANWNPVLRLTLGVVLASVCLGLLAASVHCIIRAFEFGRLMDPMASRAQEKRRAPSNERNPA